MNRIKTSLIFILSTPLFCFAQEKLSLDDAIQLALKNNYAITISRNDSAIAATNFTRGNAGFLPQVSLNASGNFANNSTKQHYSSGLDVNKNSVASNNINSGIAMNWTLFDGMKMFTTYDKLRVLSDMGELQVKINIENTISAIISSYFNIVKQKQLIRSANAAILIYKERVKIAETKLTIGSGSKLDLLQAKVDLNEHYSQLFKERTALLDVKANLNQLLANPADKDIDAKDSLMIRYDLKYDELKNTIIKKNNAILFSEKNINAADLSVKEYRSLRSPRFGVNLNYNFTRAENQAGFVLLNQNLGFNAGFTASWSLFNGMNVERQIKNAQLNLLSSKLDYDQTKTKVESDLLRAYNDFQNTLALLKLEEDNFSIAKENVDVALESFRIGKTSSLELKTAQTSFEDSQDRLVNARYDAKLAETELLRLNGMLVK